MKNFDLYADIQARTNGDIYVGVVGPVRTGKSTFIKKFMEEFVLDKIADKNERKRTTDEMPQSGAGKTIMTMQPKFVPNEAIQVALADNVSARVRLVDCVGYLVDGAQGHTEDGKPRMVKTPWDKKDIPFEKAAEIGTNIVIGEHSTIGVLVTTDGTISDIPRVAYTLAEERAVTELKNTGKPFVILLNSTKPENPETKKLSVALEEKYQIPVLLYNVLTMTSNDINELLERILFEFPVERINFDIPQWMQTLNIDNEILVPIANEIKRVTTNIVKMRDSKNILSMFEDSDQIFPPEIKSIDASTGTINVDISAKKSLFFKVISSICGEEILDDYVLMNYVKEMSIAKKEYDKIKDALVEANEKGYGVVIPSVEEMKLEEPEIIKRGSNSGVRLKASAPSLHIMKVDVETEVCPAVGSAWQTEELAKYLLDEFENNPQGIWETNMFGKPLSMLVREGINGKLQTMPEEAQVKMRRTLSKIVNEGKGGIICILL